MDIQCRNKENEINFENKTVSIQFFFFNWYEFLLTREQVTRDRFINNEKMLCNGICFTIKFFHICILVFS